MMDKAGRLDDRASTLVQQLVEKYPKHVVALMPENVSGLDFFGDVASLVRKKEMFGLLLDPKLLSAEEIRKQIEFLRVLAMIGTESIPDFIYEQTGSASGMRSVRFFAEAMKQSFLAENLAATSA